jgi:CheY-like chemotaxis protein
MCTLLVVEDDPMISQLLTVMFRDDYTLLMADTGRRALELARTEHPAAITLDLMLPDVHGRQILADLKSDPATAGIPIIVVSAYTRSLGEADRERAVRVVSKPFSPVELLDAVREAVDGR